MVRTHDLFLGPISGTPTPSRDDIDIGEQEPNASITGVLPASVLTPLSGNQVITTAGTALVDRDIFGIVEVRAADVLIRNCRIRGDATRVTSHGLIHATNAAVTNLQIIDCTIAPDVSTIWQTGIFSHDFTAKRCDIAYVVDGVGGFDTNNPGGPTDVVVDQCYLHDFPWFANAAPTQTDGTHNDGAQVQGGSGFTFRGNSVWGYFTTDPGRGDGGAKRYGPSQTQITSCIMCNANVGQTTACVFEDNWLRGGEIAFNAGGLTGNIGRAYRNKFDYGQWFQGSGGTNTHTIDLDPLVTLDHGNSGPSSTDPNRNTYIDGQNITVRTNA